MIELVQDAWASNVSPSDSTRGVLSGTVQITTKPSPPDAAEPTGRTWSAVPGGSVPIDFVPKIDNAIRIDTVVHDGHWLIEIDLALAKGVDPSTYGNLWLVGVHPDIAPKPISTSTSTTPGTTTHAAPASGTTPGHVIEPSVESAILMMDQLLHSGQSREAARLCRKAIAAHPSDARLRAQLGLIHGKQGDPGAAAAAYLKAAELDRDNPTYANQAAWFLCLSGRFAEAYPLASRANDLKANDPDYLNTLAHAAFGTARWKEAADALKQLKRISPTYFQSYSHPHCVDDLEMLAEAQHWVELDSAFPADPFAH
jgi:tetratricopeptide (TPR) repeat protein